MNQHLLIYTLAGKGRLLYRRKEYSLTAGTLSILLMREYDFIKEIVDEMVKN